MSRIADLALTVVVALVAAGTIHAIAVPLTSEQMDRALTLARSANDRERAQFHARYIIPVTASPAGFFTIDRIEITTEFRRLELIGEDHARLGDLFGRGGLQDAERALRPYHNRVAVAARLQLAPNAFVADVPVVDIQLDGPLLTPLDVRTSPTVVGQVLVGGAVEADFDAQAVGQTTRLVVIRWQAVELARVTIDFRQLE